MMNRHLRTLFTVAMTTCMGVLLATAVGCSVKSPTGYEALSQQEPLYVPPTPGVMYGYAPLSWDHPDGRTIELDVDEAWVATGPVNIYDSAFHFNIQYANNDDLRLRCETTPSGPNVPQTHFGCWTDGIEFWMAPDKGCGSSGWDHWDTVATPECWTGVLTTASGTYAVEYGYLEDSGIVGSEITWLNPSATPVLAADMGAVISLYRPERPDPREDLLVLTTVALKFYTEAGSDS